MTDIPWPPSVALPRVLLEDGPLLAVEKPTGLLTQGVPAPGGVPTLEAWVRDYIKRTYAKPGNVYLGIPHRLDRGTSGVLVFARNSKAAARLGEQFEQRRVRKEYLAVVTGVPPEPAGTLSDWLLKEPEHAQVRVVPEGTPRAKSAMMNFHLVEARDGRALLRLEPLTGRMHQIRVQLAARGWPVLGDIQYGGPAAAWTNGPADALALHAHRLTLFHPVRYDELTITSTPPATWEELGFAGIDAATDG